METQPRHAAAQVTLLEASFVFLPCLRQVPLVGGENSSSEQHSFGKLPNAAAAWCTQGAVAEQLSGAVAEQRSGSRAAEQRAAAAAEQRSSVQQQQGAAFTRTTAPWRQEARGAVGGCGQWSLTGLRTSLRAGRRQVPPC
jgi:hypothetical protein